MLDNTHFLDYSQPNSSARMEMLITIDYLLNETYDEKHAAKQVDIVEYAKNNYGMIIRRDRIAQILIHLEELAVHSPNLLPFELGVVNLPVIKKYFIKRRMFKDNEVVKIISAIKSDSKLSSEETDKLCNKFLDATVNKERYKAILQKASKRGGKVNKITGKKYIIQEGFIDAIENNAIIKFRLKRFYDGVGVSSPNIKIRNLVRKYVVEDAYAYAYQTYTIKNALYLVLYVPNERFAIITKYDNVVFLDVKRSFKDDIEYIIDNYDSIDEWVDNHFSGKDGYLRIFKLKTTIGIKGETVTKDFLSFKELYQDYWKKDFEYEEVEREIISNRIDEDGNAYEKKIIVLDAVFTIESNYSSFANWYSNGIFDKAVILEPSYLNDRFLREKIKRYAKRLTKYGERYNYEIVETLKPEYEQRMKELEAHSAERRKRRQNKEL